MTTAATDLRAEPCVGLCAEWGPMLRLSAPVILAEVGWMAMGLVDTAMVGGLGPDAIGAVGIASNLNFAILCLGFGLLMGLDTLVSQAFGAGQLVEGRRSLIQGIYLSAIVAPPLILLQYFVASHMGDFGLAPSVVVPSMVCLRALAWGTFPLLLLTAFRRYLQAVNVVRPIMIALISANLVNWFANWLLIRGRWGFPALGVEGSGWSTTIGRIYMGLFLVVATVVRERGEPLAFWRVPIGLDVRRFAGLVRLGLPAALQFALEMGAFTLATLLAGRLSAASVASHQVAINIASLTFMVPLGISSAGAVRVGHAIGRRDPDGVRTSGWAAIALGGAAMTCCGIVLICIPRAIAAAFTDDPETIAIATRLLRVAACFQLFDGLQVVTTGVLRGAGDTRTAMFVGLFAHWGIGLPIGAWLGLGRGWGVVGLWVGLSAGLVAAALFVLGAWIRLVGRLDRDAAR